VKRSNRLVILIGVFLAVAASGGVIILTSSGGGVGGPKGTPTPTPEPTVTVVIAKVDMALGDKITQDMLATTTMKISERDALGVQTYSSPAQVIGKVAGGSVAKGSVLTAASFLTAGSMTQGQDLASAVAPGKVAVSIEVDQVNGVGTLVVPGDRVDIILSVWVDQLAITSTAENPKWRITLPGGTQVTSKMIIQNRKVLVTLLPTSSSTTQTTTGGPAASGVPVAQPTAQTVTNNGQHMIVVVEVQPDEAEIIRWAQREEKVDPQNYIDLGLALRSDKDNDAPNVTTPGITFRQLVTIYGVLPPDPRGIIPADIARQISW
jgi:Flp pilus assembly protein CpaB